MSRGKPARGEFEIGRILHLKFETGNLKLDGVQRALEGVVSRNYGKADELHQRLIRFAARASRVAKLLPRTNEGRCISQQLMRASLSTAANYAEARGAESRADFIHKLRIVLKELNRDQIVAGTNCGEWSLFSRQNGCDYRGKSGTSAGLSQRPSRRRAVPPVHSELSNFEFEMQDSSNFKFPRHRLLCHFTSRCAKSHSSNSGSLNTVSQISWPTPLYSV